MKHLFSLIEALVVCTVVAILSAFIFTHAKDVRLEGQRIDCLNHMKQIQLKLEAHKLKHGKWGTVTDTCRHTGLTYFLNQDYDRIEESDGGHPNVVYLHSDKNNKGGIATTFSKEDEVINGNDSSSNGVDTNTNDDTGTDDTVVDSGKDKGKSNNGHGNNVDGVDSSNPGKSKQGEDSDPNVDDENINDDTFDDYVESVNKTDKKGNGKSNNGHGNNVDGVDSSNPGKSKQGEDSDPNVDDEKGNGKKK